MVAFNAERFISTAIESVLAQEFGDFELVVCDDASTDGTWERIARYRDPRLRAFRHPLNIGEYPNRSFALAQARGEYLVFIDADDYLYPHGLRYMCGMLERFPAAAFASALPSLPQFIYPAQLAPREYYRCQFLGPNITAPNFTQILFRTGALRAAGGFDPRFRSGDTHIQYVLARSAPCVLIGSGSAWWRRHPGQASESLLREGWGLVEFARYGGELLDHPDCPLSPGERRRARPNICRPLLRRVARSAIRGRLLHAWRLLRRSGVRPGEWRYLFARIDRPFWKDSALAAPITGDAVSGGANGLGDPPGGTEVVDRAPAIRD